MNRHYAIFSVRFDPLVGGVESFTENLARTLAQQGDDVVVVTKRIGDSPEWETRGDGVTVVRLPALSLVNDRLPLSLRNRRHRELLDAVAATGVDRVLVNTRFYPHTIDGLEFARRVDAPAVVLDHGSAYLTMGNPVIDCAIARYERLMTSKVKRFHPVFCGISAKSAEWLRTFGIETNLVIPNSIDAEEFRREACAHDFRKELGIGAEDVLVAFAGRLAPEKGGDILVRVAREFEGQPVAFALAGDGTMRKALESQAGSNTRFLGLLDRAHLSALMRDADVFCLPTRSEGFCTSLLEASAWGTPSVITDVGGAREIIRGESHGVIMGSMSDSALSDALRHMLALGPERRRSMGARARETAERECTWSSSVKSLERAFEQAASERPR